MDIIDWLDAQGTKEHHAARDEIESLRKQLAECELENKKLRHEIAVMTHGVEDQLATVTAERDELVAALKELMKYNPRTKHIGGVENGYDVPAGAAVCGVLDRCEVALAKLGADKK